MAGLCIPKSIVEKVRAGIKNGEVNLDKLYNMKEDEARALFKNYAGSDENATLINSVYEKAKIAATKKAAADYVTKDAAARGKTGAQGRAEFAQKATAGEFGKKLLSDDEAKKIVVSKIDEQIKANQAKQATLADQVSKAKGNTKADLQFKLDKLKDQEARLNVRREDTQNPSSDAMLKKIESMKGVLGDENYTDIAKMQLDKEVSPAQGKYLMEQAAKVREARAAIPEDSPVDSTERLDWGAKTIALRNFINEMKPNGTSFSENPKAVIADNIRQIGNFAKAIKTLGDISSFLRQGGKTVFTNPGLFIKNALPSIIDSIKQLTKSATDNEIMDGVQAGLISRPKALNGIYDKSGLAIGTESELVPVSKIIEKIPVLNRLYKATQVGYNAMLYRMRADIMDKYVDIAQENTSKGGTFFNQAADITDTKVLQSIGKMVNSMTGSGDAGRLGESLTPVIFSPQYIKSNFDFLTAHQFQKGVDPFVRVEAAKNLVKVITGLAGIYTISNFLSPGSVELNPLSANYGKIKTAAGLLFDPTGGAGSLVTLAARMAENKTKSTVTGKISQLNTGKFGSETSTDVVSDFLTGKLAPIPSLVMDMLNRQDFQGDKLGFNWQSVKDELPNLAPFPVQNIMQATPVVGLPDAILSELVDALGLYETVPYSKPKK